LLAKEGTMVRRVFFTSLALVLAGAAFNGADPQPDINLFGVLFLFCAYIVWFYWKEMQAGYSHIDDTMVPRYEGSGLMMIRFAPMYLRELTGRKRRRA
jgi:hypothetical protein